ncbi:MAG: hypothetical protein NT062_20280 [Proteobacteria bacterium]|nr:hypothetical protein [Pseudomonadota bacterium]
MSDPETAATVIESWSRNDLTGPLLATHPMETMTTPRAIGVRESIPTSYQPPRGVHVFAHAETSFAGDQTVWIGVAVGVCIQVGRACVSARGRFAAVVDGPNRTSIEDITRSAEDALFGGEIPFGIGPTTLWFGFGAGMGAVHTGSTGGAMPLGSETFGLRADTHVGWTIRVIDRLSLELSATLDVAQATDVEGSLSAAAMQEPHLFARFGAGVRIEGL